VTAWVHRGHRYRQYGNSRTFSLGIAPRGIAFDDEGRCCFATDYSGMTVVRVNAVGLNVDDIYRMPYSACRGKVGDAAPFSQR
jgi:hypothetical protein